MKFLILLLSTLILSLPVKHVSAQSRMELVVNFVKFSNPNQVIALQRTCQPKGNCTYIFDVCLSTRLYDFSCVAGTRVRKPIAGGEEINFSPDQPIMKLQNVDTRSDYFFQLTVYAERLNTASLIRMYRFIRIEGGKRYDLTGRGLFASLRLTIENRCVLGYRGSRCDQAVCRTGCKQGTCSQPYECRCQSGWAGILCDRLDKGRYCRNGAITERNPCSCYPGYTGFFCETPICGVSCNEAHGNCFGNRSKCNCDIGWTGESCNECKISPGCSDTNVKLSAIETTSKTATIWWQYSGNSASPDSNRQTLIQYTTEENFRNANIGSGTCGTCQLTAPLTRSPVVILSLEGHTKYVLRVLVILNNNEESILYGDWQHFTTKGHPDLPLVSGMIIENNNAKISYGNITHNGGYDFRDYFLYLQLTLASDPENCGQNCKIVKLPDLKGNVLIENLKENTTYRYRFIAENPVGESNSKWQTFATKGKPDKASISQIVTAPNTATISWNPVTFNGNYNLREVEYRLEYQKWDSKSLPKNVACGDCLQSAVNPADHSHMIVGLNTNTTYSVRLIAINKAGSSYSEWQLMTTKGVPERPQIRNFITTVRVATVSWRPITKNGGYPLNDVTYYVEYQIYVRGTNIGAGNVCRSCQSIRTSNNELISIPNLRQNTTYMVRIVAENKAGRSFSDFTYMATKGLPGNLLPFEVNPGVFTVNVTWKPVAYTGGYDKALITYVVEYAERNSSSDTLITGPCNVCYKRTIPLDSQNYHLTSLKSNTAYILRLTATNAVGTVYGQWSETITKDDAYSAAFNSSGQGYVKIRHTPQRIESTYIVSLRFKPAGTTVKDGLIFFLNNGYEEIIEQTSLLLYLHEKKLEALFVQRDGSLQVKSSVDVEPENWYHATANVSRETLTVTVNGRTQSANLGRTLTFNEFFNYAPYIGGVFDYTFLPVSASIKVVRGFHGCIKRVSVNSVKQDMENPAQQLYSWRCAP